MVCLSVLSVTFLHCAETTKDIDTLCFVYDNPVSLPDHLKFGLHQSTAYSPNFASKCRTAVDLTVGDI